jgi:hypothetical protein
MAEDRMQRYIVGRLIGPKHEFKVCAIPTCHSLLLPSSIIHLELVNYHLFYIPAPHLSSTTDMPNFPTELVSEIISYLDPANPQDLHTLTACNLVSLTFSAASRAVLFHTICISAELTVHGFYERRDHNWDVTDALYSILSESPHLGELVRVLYVDSDAYRLFYTHDDSGHGLWLPDARVDDWAYFSKVQSVYIFGGKITTVYIFLVENLQLFPELRTLAVSYQRLQEYRYGDILVAQWLYRYARLVWVGEHG